MEQILEINKGYEEKYGFKDEVESVIKTQIGLNEDVVRQISKYKKEPSWMTDFRLKALKIFESKPMPTWGADLSKINFDEIIYYSSPTDRKSSSWEDVPDYIKKTFDKLGIPEAERRFLGGVGAQYDSETIYHNLRKNLEKQGVIFCDMDTSVQKYPELVKKYFGKIVPIADNKFAALNSAVWSGGCLTAESMIFTANPGLKSIKDIEAGDIVFALSKESKIVPATVLAKIYSGRKPVYEFRVGGRTLKATSNHMFLTIEKSKNKLNSKGKKLYRVWKSLGELKEGSLIAIAKKMPRYGRSYKLPEAESYIKNYHLEKIKTPFYTTEDLMWLLGILIGDGNIYFPNKNMCFINAALPENDPVRNEAILLFKKLFNYSVKFKTNVSFTVYSKAIGYWLESIGFKGKAKTKRIPNWVFGLPKKQRLSFLGGLLDSDGYIDSNAGAVVRFELANRELIEQIKLLAISCGLFSNGKILKRERQAFFKKENRKIYSGISYSCRITGNVNKILSKNKKIISRLNYKKGTFDKYNATTGNNFSCETNGWVGFAPIKEIKFMGEEDVFDIQVEGHFNFISNGIIAHNSFVYVPPNVDVKVPLQAYFRINSRNFGQFERTLIIADKGSKIHYIEGCTSPVYTSDSLHAAVVEIVALEDSVVRYTTVQNWSNNVYNLVTKRAFAYKNATVEWVDGNLGSLRTMKYPSVFMMEEGAKANILSVAFAGKGQHQDAGAKAIHLAPNTTSTITSKSISKDGGRTSYRGLLQVVKGAHNVKANVVCDALLLDENSRSDTYPTMKIHEEDASITHEASVGKVGEEQVFYLMSRGLSKSEAMAMIILGFIEKFTKELPMDYAIELNKLIQLEMEGSIG